MLIIFYGNVIGHATPVLNCLCVWGFGMLSVILGFPDSLRVLYVCSFSSALGSSSFSPRPAHPFSPPQIYPSK